MALGFAGVTEAERQALRRASPFRRKPGSIFRESQSGTIYCGQVWLI